MSISRRKMLGNAAIVSGGILLAKNAVFAQDAPRAPSTQTPTTPAGNVDYRPVVVPDGWTLPYKLVNGVKVFHLVSEEVDHEFTPGLRARCWGYNGSVHGPLLEAVEGDRVRIYVTNNLGAPTTVHWHGMIIPSGMDGVGGLNQRSIAPDQTFMYEFTLAHAGTFMYHSHHDEMTQMAMGLTGLFVVHPRNSARTKPDRDYAIMLHEWAIEPGTDRPNPNEMTNFNVLTMNGRAFPGTSPLLAQRGQRVRIRFGNLSAMSHHPIHLHGYHFQITDTDGGEIPETARWPETTVLVPAGSTRTIEFIAEYPGDWAMHCHMTHHVMNQMGHAEPSMIGVNPAGLGAKINPLLPGYMTMGHHGMGDMGDMHMPAPANSVPMLGGKGPHDTITMGGMFTILKVRDSLPNGNADPGWYNPPEGTMAAGVTADELRAAGINADGSTAPRKPK